jgi:tetratricopeptide (TPR) repeat protein
MTPGDHEAAGTVPPGAAAAGATALAKARHLITIRRWQQALDVLGPLLGSGASAAPAHCLAAQCLLEVGRLAEAQTAARQVLAREPGNEWAHRLLAIIYLRKGRLRAAREQAAAAVRLAPRSVPALHLLTACQLATGQRTAASGTASAAIAVAPGEPLAQMALAMAAIAARDWETAERAYREGLRLHPGNHELTLGLARVMHHQDRNDDAAAAYLAAAHGDPADTRIRSGLASLGMPGLKAWTSSRALVLRMLAALLLVIFAVAMDAGSPARTVVTVGVTLTAGAALTMLLRLRGARRLPAQVRKGLEREQRNAALRWLQYAAAAATVLAIWAAVVPASQGGGITITVALLAFAAAAWLTAHHLWAGRHASTSDVRRRISIALALLHRR